LIEVVPHNAAQRDAPRSQRDRHAVIQEQLVL
jgi:hypothetical protein